MAAAGEENSRFIRPITHFQGLFQPKVTQTLTPADPLDRASIWTSHQHKQYKRKKERKRPNPKRFEQIYRTKGLTSADRSNKATLLLTVPRSHSSRLQRIHPRTCFQYKRSTFTKPFRSTKGRSNVVLEPKLYFNATKQCAGQYIIVFKHGFWLRGVQP